jgi:poly-gamma-glutamate capsule biosynthesis protein CapA/YwtB (metallophosphatase superfamily)
MNFAFLGDIAFTGILSTQPEKNSKRFLDVSQILQNFDLVFANLEVPIKVAEVKNEYKHLIHYSLLQPTMELLQLLNIGCVSLANNHIYDCKMIGLQATINLLDELGIHHTGAGWKPSHVEPVVINKNGLKIGFIAYVHRSTNPKTENFQELYINYFDTETVKKEISKLKPKVDKVICSIHWGIDYSYYPTPEQVETARELIDSGSDLIMGHHTHTLQPYEKYSNGHIFYSLGSLTFGDYVRKDKTEIQSLFRKTKKSVIVNYKYYENNVEFITTKELKGNQIVIGKRDYTYWSNRKWFHYQIKNSSVLLNNIYDFNEKVIYRVFEYFFGYYKIPIKRLLQFSNIRKVKKLFK